MSKYFIGIAIAATLVSAAHARNPHVKDRFGAPVHASVQANTNSQPVNTMVDEQTTSGTTLHRTIASPELAKRINIVLMNIKLTDEQKKKLTIFHNTTQGYAAAGGSLPSRVELGMNNVPVLDQGMHGTCATFANTAAVDAVLGKGEYISPLCSLEVGNYLETHGYLSSGWNGSFGPWVLSRFREIGIINMATQKSKGCGGLTVYPADDAEVEGNAMSLDEFYQSSETIDDDVYWYSLVTIDQRFEWDPNDTSQPEKLLNDVKKALASKNAKTKVRVSFGSLLPVDYCDAGACAKYHKTNDTWALTNAIKNDKDPEFGGHEMVFTGYDDNAIAVDNEGVKHKGLLFIRNSWSKYAGDNGDYYMTYDFFKQYVLEAQVVSRAY